MSSEQKTPFVPRPGTSADMLFVDVMRLGLSIKEYKSHRLHYGDLWDSHDSYWNMLRGRHPDFGPAKLYKHAVDTYDPDPTKGLLPRQRLRIPQQHSAALDEILAMIGKARKDVIKVRIAPHLPHQACFENCARFVALTPPGVYKAEVVLGWSVWVNEAGGAIGEAHAVIKVNEAGGAHWEFICITKPSFEDEKEMWFVPDASLKPGPNMVVNKEQLRIYHKELFQMHIVADTRKR